MQKHWCIIWYKKNIATVDLTCGTYETYKNAVFQNNKFIHCENYKILSKINGIV